MCKDVNSVWDLKGLLNKVQTSPQIIYIGNRALKKKIFWGANHLKPLFSPM